MPRLPAMQYFVRWTVPRNRQEIVVPQAFATISQALDRACDLINRHQPAEICIVDEHGHRAAADFQVRSYRRHHRVPRPAS